ncbi:double-strand break repair helicase AddA [Rhodospirillum sp. A1_3_36]|uniref:double-strand break repair helicase AddA n=1 Tax=Rhodospirillum sp. A1_3_36 TaxID=3391666 RepID=UPI0039A52977
MNQVLDPGRMQRRAADPKASAWVAASAGTGKTKVLTDRVLRLLLDGTRPERLLCLTFTKAAAAEMANRVSHVLAGWATMADEALQDKLTTLMGEDFPADLRDAEILSARARRLFASVLDCPGGLKVQTIHGFCQSLLRRFPLEAGIAPHFEILDDREAQALQLAARETILLRAREGESGYGDPTLALALAEVTSHLNELRFNEVMATLAGKRGRLLDALRAQGGPEALGRSVRALLGIGPEDTEDSLLRACCDEANYDVEALRSCAGALMEGSKTDQERGIALAAFLAEADLEARMALHPVYETAFLTQKGEMTKKPLATKRVETARPGTLDILKKEQIRVFRTRERLCSVATAQATEALMTLVDAMLGEYQRRKRSAGRMDYEDLILAARRLLEGGTAAAWVLYKLDGGIDHLLIDEAQDTSPDQWAIAKALAGEFFSDAAQWPQDRPRTVFAVGDRKQSIYGFQGADPRSFEASRQHFSGQVGGVGGRFAEVPLNTSFRSTAAVLDVVNAVFDTDPARDGVVLPGEDFTHIAFRQGEGGLVELWPPVKATTKVTVEPWKPPVERIDLESARVKLAKLMARRIKHMTAGTEILESQGRPIGPGDIMVLVRRRGGFETDLVSALKDEGVAVAGVDRMTLADQLAVMDLLALGKALLLPEDDLTLASVLKGPLVGLSEDDLFTLARARRKGERLWHRLKAQEGADNAFGRAYGVIEPLRDLAGRLAPHEFYAHVLDGPDNGRKRLLSRLGPEAEDPIDEFLALTLSHEGVMPPSLQAFVHWLEQGDIQIKRDLDQGTPQAVRIMTVHGSKGLQAPIVFLPDTMAKPKGTDLLLWHTDADGKELPLWSPPAADKDETVTMLFDRAKADQDQEYRRLLYVAMTRAADRLYVCGWETLRAPPEDCWYRFIEGAMARIAKPETAAFLEDAGVTEETEVLRYRLPQAKAVEVKKSRARTEAPPLLPEWAALPALPEPTPSRPLAPSHAGEEPPARSPLEGGSDPRRFQRGRLIHRLLQLLPDLAPGERALAARRYLARPAWALTEEEIDALAGETLAVLDDPSFASVFAPGSRAEVPLVGLVGRHAVSGQVDRLAVTAEAVLVVDFKTNRPPPRTIDGVERVYMIQMAAYRALLKTLFPDRSIRCLLLWTDGPFALELPGEQLEEEAVRLGS